MESIAKLASAGKMDENGNMDYGVKKGNYLDMAVAWSKRQTCLT